MKKATSFRLSAQAIEQLSTLVELYGTSQVSVLETLIKDRFSQSDKTKNKERKKSSWTGFSSTNDVPDTAENRHIFFAGYDRGWIHFQTRHGDDRFLTNP